MPKPTRCKRVLPRLAITLILCLLGPGVTSALTLETALARTLEKNPVIREAKARLEEAAGQRVILRATAFPDLRVILPAGVQGGQRAGENSVQPFAFARGFLTQPLFDLRVPPSFRRAHIEILLAQQRLNVAIVAQLHTARIAYHTAAYQNSLLTLSEAQRQRLENNVRAQSDRYQVGHADRQALNVARVLEGEVNPRVAQAQRTASGALLTLARTMGEDLGPQAALPSVSGALSFAPVSIDVNAEAAAALARRPDLQLARLLVAAGREDQRIIEAAYFPAIDATVSGDYIPVTQIHRGSEGTAQRLDDTVSSQINAGAAYTWRVVDNGKVIGAAMQQRAVREANQLVLEKLEAQVPRELTQLRNNLQALQARHAALTKASDVAQRNVTDVQANLTQGRSSQLEYRTAESSSLQAQAGLLGVAYEQNLALAERDRLTGRYFQFAERAAAAKADR